MSAKEEQIAFGFEELRIEEGGHRSNHDVESIERTSQLGATSLPGDADTFDDPDLLETLDVLGKALPKR